MSCRWVNSGSRDRSRAWAITIAFSFGCELRQARRYIAIFNKVKKPSNPVGEKGEKPVD